MTDWNQFMVYFGTYCFYTYGAVDGKCKVECCGTNRQHLDIAFGCVHIDLFSKETRFEILEKVDAISFLVGYYFAYLLKPFIKAAFIRCSFLVFPMRRKSFFSNFIHAPGAYL